MPDLQGHSWQLTEANQNVTDTFLADAWGKEIASTGTTVNPYKQFGKWGYQRDAANLQYVRARHLRNDLGRWVSRDPRWFEPGRNMFDYVNSRPSRYNDPSGEIAVIGYQAGSVGWAIDPTGHAPLCCGKYRAYWQFMLEHGNGPKGNVSRCDGPGYFVQHVSFVGEAYSGNHCNNQVAILPGHMTSFEYWELIPVAPREITPPHSFRGYTDVFEYLSPHNTRGWVTQAGDIRFYCSPPLDVTMFNGGDCTKYSGGYLCTDTEPPWWGQVYNGESGWHSAVADWCCCLGQKKQNHTDADHKPWWVKPPAPCPAG